MVAAVATLINRDCTDFSAVGKDCTGPKAFAPSPSRDKNIDKSRSITRHPF